MVLWRPEISKEQSSSLVIVSKFLGVTRVYQRRRAFGKPCFLGERTGGGALLSPRAFFRDGAIIPGSSFQQDAFGSIFHCLPERNPQ